MNKFNKFTIKGLDGKTIQGYKLEAKKPIAIFHIIHGLSEYAERYTDFANFLYNKNISVYSLDNRGFGRTIDKSENIGLISKNDIKEIVNDHIELTKQIKKDNIPSIVMGHSFGSFVTQKYIQEYHEDNLVILSGSRGKTMHMFVGKWISNMASIFGKNRRSKLFASLVVGNSSKNIKNLKTNVDWLSRDEKVCETYLKDPYCNKILPIYWYRQMFEFMRPKNLYKKRNLKNIKKDIPIYILSGDKDPVGKNGIKVKQLFKMYKKLNVKNISMKLYPDGRHEMLNEINNKEVYGDIYNEIKKI